jgi:peptide chain release factor 2
VPGGGNGRFTSIKYKPQRAQELGREKRSLEQVVATIDHLTTNLADNAELKRVLIS